MNEEERADWLARAIDDLLRQDRQRPKEPPPPELDREELNALMRIASARAEASHSLMHTGLRYEGEVWQRVLQRLDRRRTPRGTGAANAAPPGPSAEEAAAARALQEIGVDELREIARIRRRLAERAAMIAESHRDEVWRRVQSRLGANSEKKRWFPFFRSQRRSGQTRSAPQESRTPARKQAAGLTRIAQSRTYWSRGCDDEAAQSRQDRTGEVTPSALWPRFAVTAAIGAIVLTAVGPLPATGFADHPIGNFLWSVAEYIGFREIDQPPPVAPVDSVTSATEMTAAEASQRLGVPVPLPEAPAGFQLTSSRYFEQPLTAEGGGTFALTYAGSGGSTVVIYQEQASGADFAVDVGSATDVALSDGTPATYVEGMWQPADDGTLTWNPGGAQTLLFERNGVRTTIQYAGADADAPSLFTIADSLTAGE
jgi:hypothetical protein